MTPDDIDPRDLARTIAQVIGERHGARVGPANADPHSGRGFYGVSGDDAELEDDLEDQLLDSRDDLVAICREALSRMRVAKTVAGHSA